MAKWWRDLAVSKKLYAVVGVMAVLIASELMTLLFAMDVLSAVRTFVGGEGLWSKAQKNALSDLHRYLDTQNPEYWLKYQRDMDIPRGDRIARIELERPDFDFSTVQEGFIQGGNHPDDVKGMVKLIRRFHRQQHIARALTVWRQADGLIERLEAVAETVHEKIIAGQLAAADVAKALAAIEEINDNLTPLEVEFSEVLGEGSRWLEGVLMALLLLAVLTVESTGLFLTFTFSRNLSRSLEELMHTAREAGRGNFNVKLPVRSRDELGQLAEAINKMNENLQLSTGARHQAETASQIKSLFLANMSHEIRTPLGVILGLAEILKDPGIDQKNRAHYVETIERTGNNLTRIINDILDLSKVEAGHLAIEPSRFSLPEFIAELRTMLRVRASDTGNRLSFEIEGVYPESIRTDRTRLRQILVNLVGNSLKFTQGGEVKVTARYQNQVLSFEVSDTGAGIADQDLARLFQPFSRGDSAGNEGTGLGLVLSQRLARALGGDVTLVHSELGAGSTFRVSVRADATIDAFEPRVTHLEKPPLNVEQLRGRNILVVEDSEDNQMLLELFLRRQGVNVQFAGNGREGLRLVESGKNYDAILMDMQMPVMDGYSATRVLRDRGFNMPIIALTAHAMKQDRERCLQAGCNDYLTKPIDSVLLYSTLLHHLSA